MLNFYYKVEASPRQSGSQSEQSKHQGRTAAGCLAPRVATYLTLPAVAQTNDGQNHLFFDSEIMRICRFDQQTLHIKIRLRKLNDVIFLTKCLGDLLLFKHLFCYITTLVTVI